MAEWHVKTTGVDTNPGTEASPFRTVTKGCRAANPGDDIWVHPGTYTATAGSGQLATIGLPNCRAGTPGAGRILLQSTVQYGAILIVPLLNVNCSALRLTLSYWHVDGFYITQVQTPNGGLGTAIDGISITNSITGTVIRNCRFHRVGRVCVPWSHAGGYDGISIDTAFNTIIEDNIFSSGGSLRFGEEGCTSQQPTPMHNDHGIYIRSPNGLDIRRNLFYDQTRGYPLHFYHGAFDGQVDSQNVRVYNNTFADKTVDPGAPRGHIIFASQCNNITVKNNIFYNPQAAPINIGSNEANLTNVIIDHNLSDHIDTDFVYGNPAAMGAGCSITNNEIGTPPGFVNAAARDYHLQSTSPAINAGVNVGLPFTGPAPDLGYAEFTGSVADIIPPAAPTGLVVT